MNRFDEPQKVIQRPVDGCRDRYLGATVIGVEQDGFTGELACLRVPIEDDRSPVVKHRIGLVRS